MKKTTCFRLRFLSLLLLLGTACLWGGCKKYLDVQSSRLTKEEDFWNSIEDTRSSLFGTYGLLRAAMVNNNGYWLVGDVRLGDFRGTGRLDIKAIRNNNLRFNTPVIQELANWRRFYAVIDNANLFIENAHKVLEQDPRYTKANYKVDMAQARVLRAFTYFYMVRIWGDVPLITLSQDGSFVKRARTSQDKVLQFASNEILSVIDQLPYKYGSKKDPVYAGDYYDADEARWAGVLINKLSAYAILAHIAAWQENYIDAAVYSGIVMEDYKKVDADYVSIESLTSPTGLFYSHKANQLFALVSPWSNKEGSVEGHIEDLTLASPIISKNKPDIYVPKDSILAIFNLPNDLRFKIDTTGKPVSTYFSNYEGLMPIFNKVSIIRNGNTDGSFAVYSSALVFTRLEEVALLHAEALAVLNDPDAVTYLNAVRNERGLSRYLSSDGNLIDNIFQERRRELMGEGWRWYDRVRYNRIKRNNPNFNQLLDQGGIYWPVAEKVLGTNELLTQNKYWD